MKENPHWVAGLNCSVNSSLPLEIKKKDPRLNSKALL